MDRLDLAIARCIREADLLVEDVRRMRDENRRGNNRLLIFTVVMFWIVLPVLVLKFGL